MNHQFEKVKIVRLPCPQNPKRLMTWLFCFLSLKNMTDYFGGEDGV